MEEAVNKDVLLEMKHIYKHFGGVHALNDVSFTLRRGEVHALVGENGAGKSTLMKILMGLYQPDQGEIILNGEKTVFHSVKSAQDSGISMIFQEFNQVRVMKVMENIYLGREPKTKFGLVDFKKMLNTSVELLSKLGVNIDPFVPVSTLSVAKQQMIEIVKALSMNAEIIIMDEPTSALSQKEIEPLLSIVRTLRDQGKTIIYISHKMEEIYSICESVTILRDGVLIHTGKVADIAEKDLIRMMVNREVNDLFPKQKAEIGEVILQVKGLTVNGLFKDINFELHQGEILGIAGLVGAGRTELVESIIGIRKLNGGEIYLRGKKIINKIPGDALKKGIAMVPENRTVNGVFLRLSIRDNILASSSKKCMGALGLSKDLETSCFKEYEGKLGIKASSPEQLCGNLSGGNQQKVAVARVLNADPEIIILDEPTRGIDVKTKSEIHRLMSSLAVQGKAVLMVSSELPEILGMSDRILVMHEGVQTGILGQKEATAEEIMKLAVKTA